ncbi:hypothetical protein AAY473_020734 [Plecturocebus cupreus]
MDSEENLRQVFPQIQALLTKKLVLHRTSQGLVPEAQKAAGLRLDPLFGGIADGSPVQVEMGFHHVGQAGLKLLTSIHSTGLPAEEL